MARTIQHKRGLEVNLPVLEVAEIALTTDTAKPFIGGSSGNIELAKKGDLDTVVQNISDIANPQVVPVATGRALALTDAGKILIVSATATLTVPPNDTVAFPISTQIIILSAIAEDVIIAEGQGVTVRRKTGLKIDGQYAGATLIKTATDTWYLIGALKA
jgi:hypothetical protein